GAWPGGAPSAKLHIPPPSFLVGARRGGARGHRSSLKVSPTPTRANGNRDRRIFSDQAVYDDEMEKIFGRSWLMIGHETLVPEPDDFFHTYMGEDPVILTRDGHDRLHALLNMCRHRGNRVVRCDDGNAKRFLC